VKNTIFALLLCFACTPKLKVDRVQTNGPYSLTKSHEPFAIVEQDTLSAANQLLGTIEIKDKGLTLNCDYETVLRMAEDKAKALGGNCLVLTEHRKPDMKSTCHRIKCNVLKIEDPEKYEKQILWHALRPLKIKNFKGDTEKRPFQAATYTRIKYYAKTNLVNGRTKIVTECIFDCNLSYFKPSEQDSIVIDHEQLHFDITEVFARKFRKRLKEETTTYALFLENHERIFSEVQKEWALKQDEYDSEVYADHSLQNKWSSQIKEALLNLKEYDAYIVELK
jgi:hypothetical protein